jgi:hypothetical protein
MLTSLERKDDLRSFRLVRPGKGARNEGQARGQNASHRNRPKARNGIFGCSPSVSDTAAAVKQLGTSSADGMELSELVGRRWSRRSARPQDGKRTLVCKHTERIATNRHFRSASFCVQSRSLMYLQQQRVFQPFSSDELSQLLPYETQPRSIRRVYDEDDSLGGGVILRPRLTQSGLASDVPKQ